MENEKQEIETITPAGLLQLAVMQNLDIEKLERLMQLQTQWEYKLAHSDFLDAMSKFQFQCPPLEKTKKVDFELRTGGRTKYNYAPLGEIAATIKQAMNDNGLSHRWELDDSTDRIICTCIISHVGGHSERTAMSGAKDSSGSKNEIQQRGFTITYLQRYTLIAALGISTADEDVDGNASGNDSNKSSNVVVKKTNWEEKLLQTKSLIDLQNEWAKIPVVEKVKLEPIKDKMKKSFLIVPEQTDEITTEF